MQILLEDWIELRDWSANLLRTQFRFGDPREILQSENRGNAVIPDTEWHYRTHGIGVEVYQEDGRAIDFDFDTDSLGFKIPDPWRLMIFAETEVAARRPMAEFYRIILSDTDHFKILAAEVIAANERRNANKSEQATPRKPSDQFALNPGAPVL